jgi:hypothetical protein
MPSKYQNQYGLLCGKIWRKPDFEQLGYIVAELERTPGLLKINIRNRGEFSQAYLLLFLWLFLKISVYLPDEGLLFN